MDELLARLRALHRRTGPSFESPRVRIGDNVVDLAARTIHNAIDGTPLPVRLTPTEWHLLEVLLRNPGRLLSQRQLLHEVWGPGYQEGNLRVYMAQLRRKLEPDHHRPRLPAQRARHGLPVRARRQLNDRRRPRHPHARWLTGAVGHALRNRGRRASAARDHCRIG